MENGMTLTLVDEPPAVDTGRPVVHGLAASSGIATGVVRILRSPNAGREPQRGEVLVAATTNPAAVPSICDAAALVTDRGGITCHAAIVARELGVPCVVGTRTATSTLRDGEMVTVDGERGLVYEGLGAAPVAATVSPHR
jgi:pyruvate,water dikinase